VLSNEVDVFSGSKHESDARLRHARRHGLRAPTMTYDCGGFGVLKIRGAITRAREILHAHPDEARSPTLPRPRRSRLDSGVE